MSLARESYRRIRESLLSEETLFRERLSISDLSRRLGIGRSPVRDAVNRLVAEGLLETVPRSGIIVRDITLEEMREVIGLREALEPYAARQACAGIDYEQRARLRRLCLEMARLARATRDSGYGDERLNSRLRRADWLFHGLILEAAGNSRLRKIVEDHHLLLRKVRYPSLPDTRHLARTLLEHWRIYRALARRDPEAAAQWMARHARRGGKAMLKSWKEVYRGGK